MITSKFKLHHYDILLGQLLRSETIAIMAFARLEPHHFTEVGAAPHQGVVYKIAKDYYSEYSKLPDDAALAAGVKDYVVQYLSARSDLALAVVKGFKGLLEVKKLVDDRSEPYAKKIAEYMAETCVYSKQALTLLDEARDSGSIEGLATKLKEIEVQKSAMAGGRSISGLSTHETPAIGERMKTGLPWLDMRFQDGAGPVTGSLVCIIAPQGHGKTTTGIQLCVSQALQHHHALLVLAEEGATIPMKAKLFGCALGVKWPDITQSEGETFADQLADAIAKSGINKSLAAKKIAAMDEYLHVLDITQVKGELELISAEVESLTQEGKKPCYIYVDWAGMIAEEIMGKTGRTKEQELKALSYALNDLAVRTGCTVIVSQQMSAAAVEKGPFHLNTMYCSEDCRGFTQPAKYAFVINPVDPKTNISLFIVAKARDDDPGEPTLVKLRGEQPALYDVSSQYTCVGRSIRPNTGGSVSAVPKE